MTLNRTDEINEQLKFYLRWRATIPDKLNTLDYKINELMSKQVLLKSRRNKKVEELKNKKDAVLAELNDVDKHISALAQELRELNSNK